MSARVREDSSLELVAACCCGSASPLRLVLYLPLPVCTGCRRTLWEPGLVMGLRGAWEAGGGEALERWARKVGLWSAGQWRQGGR
jgi:hypothetical protein